MSEQTIKGAMTMIEQAIREEGRGIRISDEVTPDEFVGRVIAVAELVEPFFQIAWALDDAFDEDGELREDVSYVSSKHMTADQAKVARNVQARRVFAELARLHALALIADKLREEDSAA